MTQRAHGSAINKHEWYGMLETKLFLLLRIVSNSGHVLFLDFSKISSFTLGQAGWISGRPRDDGNAVELLTIKLVTVSTPKIDNDNCSVLNEPFTLLFFFFGNCLA